MAFAKLWHFRFSQRFGRESLFWRLEDICTLLLRAPNNDDDYGDDDVGDDGVQNC